MDRQPGAAARNKGNDGRAPMNFGGLVQIDRESEFGSGGNASIVVRARCRVCRRRSMDLWCSPALAL